jgi:hypothetical protein
MFSTTQEEAVSSFTLVKSIEVSAPPDILWQSILDMMGPLSEMPGGKPFPMTLEPWPGGRWFRDLGDNTGHYWGHVQVIKPPALLEIWGPLFMSFPALSHVTYRIVTGERGTRLQLTHRAMGLIPREHREGVHEGWSYELNKIKELAERRNRR